MQFLANLTPNYSHLEYCPSILPTYLPTTHDHLLQCILHQDVKKCSIYTSLLVFSPKRISHFRSVLDLQISFVSVYSLHCFIVSVFSISPIHMISLRSSCRTMTKNADQLLCNDFWSFFRFRSFPNILPFLANHRDKFIFSTCAYVLFFSFIFLYFNIALVIV